MKKILWKLFSSIGVIWLWMDLFNQNADYSRKNLVFYSIVCWSFLLLVLGATIHSPIYGFTAGFLLVLSLFTNTIYRLSESLGLYFIVLFWLSIFIGVWFFITENINLLINL